MLNYAIAFVLIAIIAAVLDFSGIAGQAADIVQFMFVVVVVLAVIAFLPGWRGVT
jgi:uncharacterized membrane protein YtjA (UPF0391 family)